MRQFDNRPPNRSFWHHKCGFFASFMPFLETLLFACFRWKPPWCLVINAVYLAPASLKISIQSQALDRRGTVNSNLLKPPYGFDSNS